MAADPARAGEPWEVFDPDLLLKKSEIMWGTGWSSRTADVRLSGLPSALFGKRDRRWRGRDVNEVLRAAFERGQSKVPATGAVAAQQARIAQEREEKRALREERRRQAFKILPAEGATS